MLPRLLITADVSHHVVCCERLLDDDAPEDKQLLDSFIPNVSFSLPLSYTYDVLTEDAGPSYPCTHWHNTGVAVF